VKLGLQAESSDVSLDFYIQILHFFSNFFLMCDDFCSNVIHREMSGSDG